MVSCLACSLSHVKKFGITFHRFPKKPEIRAAWLKFVNKSDGNIPKFAVLCSQHFEESDFDKSAFRVLLSRSAIPTKIVQGQKRKPPQLDESVSTDFTNKVSTEAGRPVDFQQRDGPACNSNRTQMMQKVRRQLDKVYSVNVQQAQTIRNLQKRCWFQKKRILQLHCALNELLLHK